MKQHGFVLITVTLMLSMMTLLVVANLLWVNLSCKRYHQMHQYQENTLHLEQAAEVLAARMIRMRDSECMINQKSDEKLKNTILLYGCLWAHYYRYAMSDLGAYPCVRLATYSTHHWLLSVIDERRPWIMLQWRIATPIPLTSCPDTQQIEIHKYLLTRRIIDAYM